MNNPNCTICKHYYITLDERLPRACKIFNIKGRSIPSVDVRRFTGNDCPVFEMREEKSKTVITKEQLLDTFA